MIKISTYFKKIRKHPWCPSLRILIPLYATYILFVLSVLLVFIPNEKKQMIAQKENMIQKLTESVWSLLSEYDQRVQMGELSPREARQRAIKRIGNLRYGSDGKHYFWIIDMQYRVIMHPYLTELEGKNLANIQNIEGNFFPVDAMNRLKNEKSGHVSYMWQWNDDPGQTVLKLSFFKRFSPWNWVTGTGIYVNDIQQELEGIIQNFIHIFSGILVVIVILSIYISWQTVQIQKKQRLAEKARSLEELRLKKLLELNQMSDATMDELIIFSLKETVRLTQSDIGYLGFLNSDETELTMHIWPPSGSAKQCPSSKTKEKYHINEAGLWAEAARRRAVVVINHYDHAPNKEEFPFGQIEIFRLMSIPVFENKKMVALAGTCNKAQDYEESDARQLQLMMDGMWKIIQKKTAEDNLRKSEERYRLLADNATDVIWIIRLSDMTFSYISPSVKQIMGYAPHEYIGEGLQVLHLMDEVMAKLFEIIMEDLERDRQKTISPKQYRTLELKLPKKDGSKTWTEITARFLRDKAGTPDRILGIARDISTRKHLEKKLRQSHKMEALGTLSGGIAHDFNNILSSILGFTELARMEDIEGEKTRQYLNKIFAAGSRAQALIKHIQTFSRQADVKKEIIQIVPLIREALAFLRASIPMNIHIQHFFDEPEGTVMANATQIHQILMNLFTNAAHAMQEKGGTLGVRLKAIHIQRGELSRVNGLHPGPYFQLSVADTGCGISPDIIEKIFEPFFTTKKCGEGTGMGLSIAYGIIRDMGGTISVYSEVNTGTTFQVMLPAHHKNSRPNGKSATPSFETPKGGVNLLYGSMM